MIFYNNYASEKTLMGIAGIDYTYFSFQIDRSNKVLFFHREWISVLEQARVPVCTDFIVISFTLTHCNHACWPV